MSLQKLNNLVTLLLAAGLLCAAAVFNGYPLVFPDTGCYLGLEGNWLRSFFYNLFLAPSLWLHSLWVVVILQALIVAHLLRLVLRTVFGLASPWALLGLTVPLCLLSNLPWFVGFVMPDIFTGVLILTLFLQCFCPSRLGAGEKAYLFGLTVLAIVVHFSHLPLAVGLLLVAWLFKLALRKYPLLPCPVLGRGAVAVTVALMLLLANGYRSSGTLTITTSGYAFLLARLVADGPAVRYLREHGAEQHYALCAYLDQLPMAAEAFLWPADSPFRKVGWITGYHREGWQIVWGTLRHYPFQVAKHALLNTGRQLFMIRNCYGLGPYLDTPYPTAAIKEYFPGEFAAYEQSRQSRNGLGLKAFNWVHLAVIGLCLPLAAALGWRFGKRRDWLPVLLLATIVGAYGLSAFITATLSGPYHRYGSRMIWLLPFFCVASILYVIHHHRNQT